MSNPKLPSRGLMIGGALLILVGVMVFASSPAEIAVGEPGWFDNESTRGDRFLIAFALAGVGSASIVAGLILSQGVRRIDLPLPAEPVAKVSTSARLDDLEQLRRRGLVNDHEYRVKRNQILARL